MDTAAVARMAAVRVDLQTATAMQIVTRLMIVVVMFQVIVRRKVLHSIIHMASSDS